MEEDQDMAVVVWDEIGWRPSGEGCAGQSFGNRGPASSSRRSWKLMKSLAWIRRPGGGGYCAVGEDEEEPWASAALEDGATEARHNTFKEIISIIVV